MTKLLSIGFLVFFFMCTANAAKHSDEENRIPEKDELYICGELESIKAELDNAYCSSSNSLDVQADCRAMKTSAKACSVEKKNDSVLIIHLGKNESGELAEINDLVAETKARESGFDDHPNFKQKPHIVNETFGLSPYLSLKCINSISNKWFCGFQSSSYRQVEISETNQEIKIKLTNELFDMASSCVSKI